MWNLKKHIILFLWHSILKYCQTLGKVAKILQVALQYFVSLLPYLLNIFIFFSLFFLPFLYWYLIISEYVVHMIYLCHTYFSVCMIWEGCCHITTMQLLNPEHYRWYNRIISSADPKGIFYTGPIICDSKMIIYIVKIRNPTDSEGDVSPVLQVAFSEATAEGSEALTLYSRSL